MSSKNDEIRRQLGGHMPTPRLDRAEMTFTVRTIPPAGQCTAQDEQRDGAASGNAAENSECRYFDTLESVRAWYASERARREHS